MLWPSFCSPQAILIRYRLVTGRRTETSVAYATIITLLNFDKSWSGKSCWSSVGCCWKMHQFYLCSCSTLLFKCHSYCFKICIMMVQFSDTLVLEKGICCSSGLTGKIRNREFVLSGKRLPTDLHFNEGFLGDLGLVGSFLCLLPLLLLVEKRLDKQHRFCISQVSIFLLNQHCPSSKWNRKHGAQPVLASLWLISVIGLLDCFTSDIPLISVSIRWTSPCIFVSVLWCLHATREITCGIGHAL